jgi:GAF domain-containing protein
MGKREHETGMSSTKTEVYTLLNRQLTALLENERDCIANAANCSVLLYDTLDGINWCGFYFLKGNELVLGPFQGKPACIRIPMGKGVCGTAAETREIQMVANVHDFPGHIACDAASNSEIVVPLVRDGRMIGVLDIDSPEYGRFDDEDRIGLEQLAAVFLKHTDFE